MKNIERGLHETLVTEALAERIARLDESLQAQNRPIRKEEAGDRLALHLSRCLMQAINSIPESDRLAKGVDLAQRVIDEIDKLGNSKERSDEYIAGEPRILHAVNRILPSGKTETIGEPLTPLLDTTLLTNAPGEPRVGKELEAEIDSADSIDVVMAFVRFSGIRPLLGALRRHVEAGKPIRLLTTIYTGSTEGRALDELEKIGAQVRISYDVGRTRLHAKAWLFYRNSGFSTAYIGSSNLTQTAQVDGLEWNVRASAARNPDVINKVRAVFESYWQDGDFVDYDAQEFTERMKQQGRDHGITLPPTDLHALPFQARLLELIALSRSRGYHRNLLVAATGTGKTVMAALDYLSLKDDGKLPSLLFVAHRKEILSQAQATFRYALRDATFGDLWVGGNVPTQYQHLFASIQTLRENTLERIDSKQFDVVIIDEFHHAAAASYQRLLKHLEPKELLGLTATPERSDGLSVLDEFDGRIAAELRLWDAVDQQRLTPFAYFGVADNTDLTQVTWRRGAGYDVEGLTNVLTADDAIAHRVLNQLNDHVENIQTIRALGFCVSVKHAQFMARVFNNAGLESLAIWADTNQSERESALQKLGSGELRVLFSVDLFNEGVDVPSVDTLMMLRPTESGTLFLQQLGRGLRHFPGKRVCTVLDFVGQHRREFRFDKRFSALLGGTRRQVQKQVENGFPFLPAGCHLSLDSVASKIVLESLKHALPATWRARVEELKAMANPQATLQNFLEETGLALEDVYASNRCWSDLKEEAGLPIEELGEFEKDLRRAVGRLLHVDDESRLMLWSSWLAAPDDVDIENLSVSENRLLRMLVSSVVAQACKKDTSLADGWAVIANHPQVRQELIELFGILNFNQTHLHPQFNNSNNLPLQVHARYTRIEILAACGVGEGARVSAWQTGVYRVDDINTDLLAFTLDKTDGGFSPTTRYRDYAISRELIHWESQNVTRADGATGIRYQNHESTGGNILMFARERKDDRAFWFLGLARYVSHEGERPMAITWRLDHSLPGDLYAGFAAAVG
jgi:superfamily II DNA or RNA helicase